MNKDNIDDYTIEGEIESMFKRNKNTLEYYTVVGLRYYIKEWGTIELNSIVQIKKEENNKYDKNAMACYHENKKIGYISKDENLKIKPGKFKVVMRQGLYPVLAKIKEMEKKDYIRYWLKLRGDNSE